MLRSIAGSGFVWPLSVNKRFPASRWGASAPGFRRTVRRVVSAQDLGSIRTEAATRTGGRAPENLLRRCRGSLCHDSSLDTSPNWVVMSKDARSQRRRRCRHERPRPDGADRGRGTQRGPWRTPLCGNGGGCSRRASETLPGLAVVYSTTPRRTTRPGASRVRPLARIPAVVDLEVLDEPADFDGTANRTVGARHAEGPTRASNSFARSHKDADA
jgi:hypothetical protein